MLAVCAGSRPDPAGEPPAAISSCWTSVCFPGAAWAGQAPRCPTPSPVWRLTLEESRRSRSDIRPPSGPFAPRDADSASRPYPSDPARSGPRDGKPRPRRSKRTSTYKDYLRDLGVRWTTAAVSEASSRTHHTVGFHASTRPHGELTGLLEFSQKPSARRASSGAGTYFGLGRMFAPASAAT